MTLTPAENLILNATTSRHTGIYGVVPASQTYRDSVLAFGLRSDEYRRFSTEMSKITEWLFRVINDLSSDTVKVPKGTFCPDTFEDAVAFVREIAEAKLREDTRDRQEAFDDESAEDFQSWYPGTTVEDGKVTNPWSPNCLKAVRWFLDNITLTGIWLIYQKVRDAVMESVSENMGFWAEGCDNGNPQHVAHEAFEETMKILYADIEKL